MDLVSVVIPIGKGISRTQLEKAIDSVLNQTYKNIEIVLVFEANKEQIEINNLLEKYKEQKNIRGVSQSQKGIGNARFEGVNYSQGKYICMLDADDEMIRHKIERQIKEFANTNADVMFTNAYKILISKNLKFKNRKKNFSRFVSFKDLHFINTLYASTVMFKSEVVKTINYNNLNYTEDYNLWLRLMIEKKKIYYINEFLVKIYYDELLFYRRSKIGNIFAEIKNFRLKNQLSRNYFKNFVYLLIHILYFISPPKFKYYVFRYQNELVKEY